MGDDSTPMVNAVSESEAKGMTGPCVSVVVPCYNIEEYVGSTLMSIASQTYENTDVILVDDGSTDGTNRVLQEFARERRNWRVLLKTNGGLSAARNAGIDLARGSWLVFVDGDDLLEPTAIERLLQVAIASNVSLVCANHFIQANGNNTLVNVNPTGSEAVVRIMSQHDAFESILYHREIDVSAWGKIFARYLFDSVRFPEGRIYEDTYYFDDILAEVGELAYLTTPLYYYVMRQGSIVNVPWSGKQIQFIEAADKFAKHAEELYPDLARAALRRRVHARLSVLRYMENIEHPDEIRYRDEVVGFIREHGRCVLRDKFAPNRDKIGILLASLSPKLFFWFWRLYSVVRKDR